MKIGVVTDFYYPWIAGPAVVVRNLADGLAHRGHVVEVLAPSPSGRPGIETDGLFRVTRARTLPSPFGYGLRASPWPWETVRRWLDTFQPDVVHVHHPFPLSAAAVLLARKRQLPVVATNHTIPDCSLWGIRNLRSLYTLASAGFGWWLVQLLERCQRVATPTRTAGAALRSLGYRRTIEAISNGVDTGRFSPGVGSTSLRARLGLDSRPVVLYTGRLDAEKQMDVWLRAAAEASKRVDAQYVVGGQGTERARLEDLARQLGIEHRVCFAGYLPDAELPSLYRLADVFMITSTVELQSVTTLEAVASGVPVVAADGGALPELVKHGHNGYLIPPSSWEEGAGALTQLLLDPSRRTEMGRASRAIALQHDLQVTIDKYERLLEKCAHDLPGDD